MASFGKLNNSIASFTNENTLALVNVNIDLSLFRCEPIAEFLPVGSALTTRRKEEAETGRTHKTACRLGFLFSDIIPDTPELRKAYGKRVSEIISHPSINPQGTEDHGPFKPFIGADCTSVWAAATSGDAAIAVLLLACMLADAFDAKSAVSIWSEVIEERKNYIGALLEGGKLLNPNTVVAAQQDISRDELRGWDASARSWLRRADMSMNRQRTQFTLIAENVTIPFPGRGSLFERVTQPWIRAMDVFEKLLNNSPQEACDRAIIAGISAWHLYPDLLVFQKEFKKISFNDALIPNSGVLSLGLEYKGMPSDGFIRWSLALSHLKYYGDPVPVRSNEGLHRVRMPQLWLVALGVLFNNWGLPYTSIEVGMSWFAELGTKLRSVPEAEGLEFSCVLDLCSSVLDLGQCEQAIATKLVKYGCRRGSSFFGTSRIGAGMPFFGLCKPAIMSALSKKQGLERGIGYLRHLAQRMGLQPHEAIISYQGKVDGQNYTEWVTIAPIKVRSAQEPPTPDLVSDEAKYYRWIQHDTRDERESHTLKRRLKAIQKLGERSQLVTHDDGFERIKSPFYGDVACCWKLPHRSFLDNDGKPSDGKPSNRKPSNRKPSDRKHRDRKPSYQEPSEQEEAFIFDQLAALGPFDLWCRVSKDVHFREWQTRFRNAIAAEERVEYALPWLKKVITAQEVVDYLLVLFEGLRPTSPAGSQKNEKHSASTTKRSADRGIAEDALDYLPLITKHAIDSPKFSSSIALLGVLQLAARVYRDFPSATVSLRTTETDISKSAWIPGSMKALIRGDTSVHGDKHFNTALSKTVEDHFRGMTREQSLACVAMFESGGINLDPKTLGKVIALCHEDSIFVAEILVSDPGVEISKLGLRHMIGNVGQPGMVLMISPVEPRVRAPGHSLDLVDHFPYDSQVTDKLEGTSLHLSFTTWKMPLDWNNTGTIDHEIFLFESVVSVQQDGKWIADIDVLRRERNCPDSLSFPCQCELNADQAGLNIVALDTWDELLDAPPCTGVLRAHKNWVARLAAVSILARRGRSSSVAIINGSQICWRCVKSYYTQRDWPLPRVFIH